MDAGDRARRWELVLPHRDRLLRLARKLVRDPGDAEACVQEALTRCVTFANLDESNVEAFLVATTRRLCVDHHRGHARAERVVAKLRGHAAYEASPEDVVCDRAEAAWVTARLADLPRRQRAVALARAAGYSPQEIAERFAVSYKTVETLLYRVRTRARIELERAYSLVLLVAVRRPRTAWAAFGVTSVAVVTGVSVLLAPATPRQGAAPTPVVPFVTHRPTGTPHPVAALSPVPYVTPAPAPQPLAAATIPAPVRHPPTSGAPLSRCPAPPHFADPCVSPDPSDPPGFSLLDCIRYGIDQQVGFRCNSSPTPSPAGPRDSDGGDT